MIVGAGLSGLASAVRLCQKGIPPLVLEQKPAPGGRASSFTDSTTGDTVDNGQHVLIGGYHRSIRFLTTIGSVGNLAIQDSPALFFHDPDRGFLRFSVPRLPAPFHLLGAIATSNLLTFRERAALLRAGQRIRSSDEKGTEGQTVADWLKGSGQSARSCRMFWNPLSVSIMNEMPDRASARSFVRSLKVSLLAGWKETRLAIPRTDLRRLYAEPAVRFIREHGGRVMYGADVTQVLTRGGETAAGVRLKNGLELTARALIIAIPPHKLEVLLSAGETRLLPGISPGSFTYAPIVSVHFWYETDFMPQEFLGLIGRTTQWVFNRKKIERSVRPGGHLSMVVSAAHSIVGLPNEQIIVQTIEDLRTVFGRVADSPVHHVVVREKRATISLTPRAEGLRPSQKTTMENLFLAGDWTDTGLPATIEGAVMSGEICADHAADLVHQR